jgi:hypothetical protein
VVVAVVVGVGGVGVEEAMVVAALWAVPLASAPSRSDRVARVCGGIVGMVNVGSRAPTCPPFNIALRERRPTAIQGKRPRSGRGSDWFPNPEITFLTATSSTILCLCDIPNHHLSKLSEHV